MNKPVRVKQSKIGIVLIFLVAAFIIAASTIQCVSLRAESAELAITERSLEHEIAEADQVAADLESQEKYMATKKYIEDQAKDKLGLVYPDEIVIKPSKDE